MWRIRCSVLSFMSDYQLSLSLFAFKRKANIAFKKHELISLSRKFNKSWQQNSPGLIWHLYKGLREPGFFCLCILLSRIRDFHPHSQLRVPGSSWIHSQHIQAVSRRNVKKRKLLPAHSAPFKQLSASPTQYLHSHSVGHKLISWPHLAAKDDEKCIILVYIECYPK